MTYDMNTVRVRQLESALRDILNELGVPSPDHPAPVANAVEIARTALQWRDSMHPEWYS